MSTIAAIDISNHNGWLTADVARCWRDTYGIRLVIHNVYVVALTRHNLSVLRDAGIPTHLYVYLFENGGVQGDVDKVLQCAQGFDIPMVWLDVEGVRETAGWTPAQRLHHVQAVAAALRARGFRVGIYTGLWYWRGYMANTTACASLPLWDANYSTAPLNQLVPAGYGGWTMPVGRQYRSGALPCGWTGDLNVFNAAYLGAPSSGPGTLDPVGGIKEDDMTPEEVRQIVRQELANYTTRLPVWESTSLELALQRLVAVYQMHRGDPESPHPPVPGETALDVDGAKVVIEGTIRKSEE